MKTSSQELQFVYQDVFGMSALDKALEQLRRLYEGRPVPTDAIRQRLGVSRQAVSRVLGVAAEAGMARAVPREGWIPVHTAE